MAPTTTSIMIEQALLNCLNTEKPKIVPEVKANKYKIKFTKVCKDEQTGREDAVYICVRITKADGDKYAVEF